MNDHSRGCEGREYTCTCGYDTQQDARIAALSAENERLRKALEFYACTKESCDCVEGRERSDDLTCGFVARAALEAKP